MHTCMVMKLVDSHWCKTRQDKVILALQGQLQSRTLRRHMQHTDVIKWCHRFSSEWHPLSSRASAHQPGHTVTACASRRCLADRGGADRWRRCTSRWISRLSISAGFTPPIRAACPMSLGRICTRTHQSCHMVFLCFGYKQARPPQNRIHTL